MTTLRILFEHSLRTLRFGGWPLFFSTLTTLLGVFAFAVFATLWSNAADALAHSTDDIGVVAFADLDSAKEAATLAARIRALPACTAVTVVPPTAANLRVQRALDDDPNLSQVARGLDIGWVFEVTTADGQALAEALSTWPELSDVMHGKDEVREIQSVLAVVRTVGTALGLLVALIVVLVINNTIRLTLFARREEIEILKLVGATHSFVRIPFLVEGLAQGLVGAILALSILYLAHASIADFLERGLLAGRFSFGLLPPGYALALVLASALLGVVGAGWGVGRYLRV